MPTSIVGRTVRPAVPWLAAAGTARSPGRRIATPAVVALAVLVALVAAAAPAIAQPGTIAGTVVRTGTLAPVEAAQVQVEGTQLGGVTDAGGRFRITGLTGAVGDAVTLRVRRLGFQPATQTARIGDQAVRVLLAESTVQLDELVITGTAGAQERRSIGNAVVTIDASQELQRSAAPTLTTLLQSRSPGVVISPTSGRVGAGPTIQIRGRSSLSLSSNPIVYIDGVRVNNATGQGPESSGLGGQNSDVSSRLNDINPEDIESIEIIKGPAAATIYGTEAANGVIQIITKKGAQGEARWTAKVEQGAVWFRDPEGRIPINYARDPDTEAIVPWNPIQQERERGTPIFSTGHTQSYNLALSGGTGPLTYYLSGSFDDAEGVEPNNYGKNFSGQVSLGVAATEKLDIQTSLNVVRATNHLGADEGLSSMLGISTGHALTNPNTRGFGFAPPEVPQQLYDNVEDINRFTGGVTLSHRPADWFAQRLVMGLDYTSDDSRALERFAPPELRGFVVAIAGPAGAAGRITQTLRNHSYITGDYSGTATFALTPALSSATSVGGQFVRKQLKGSTLGGTIFPGPGVETVSGTTTKGTPSQSLIVNTTIGAYVQQQFGWNERLFLTGAVRVDNNSAFGEDFDLVTYPKLSAAWVISEEPFWAGFGDAVNTLKLRAAYGQSGQQPNAFSALRTVTNAPRANGVAGVTPGTLGNPDLEPERGSELEVGFEAGLFDRLSLDFTYYTRRTEDAILSRDLAPSSGFAGNQIVNIGETSNRGLELQARLQAVTREEFGWEITGNVSTNRDRVEDLGDVPAGSGLTRNAEGYPIGGFWAKRIASADRDAATHAVTNILCENGPPSDGTPAPCNQAVAVFVGTPTPKVLAALSNTFRIGSRLTLYGLVDGKWGHRLYNSNDANRCAFSVCDALFFPERYSTEYLAGITRASATAGVADQWVQDASFVKLREISATYRLPEQWFSRAGIAGATLTVAGRNLVTWSDYNGIDPEVRSGGTFDQGLLPALTQVVTSLSLSF